MRKRNGWLAILLVAGLIGASEGQPVSDTPQDSGVEGFTEPIRKLDVIPAETGVLSGIKVHEGDHVKKNQLLAYLDCDTQEVALAIAKNNMEAHGKLDSAKAERDLRQWRLAKINDLHEKGDANEEEVTRVSSELTVANANLLGAQEQHVSDRLEYNRISSMLERRMMRSPFDGVVTRLYKEDKDYVGGNNSPVMTIMELDKLRVTFTLPTGAAMRLKLNQTVPLTFPTTNQKAMGTVEFISPVTEAESDTVRVKVLIDNEDGKYRCGIRCAINLAKLNSMRP
jgi:RND family efflux transporter MFP subunit